MNNVNAGILFDSWNALTQSGQRNHRNEFMPFMFSEMDFTKGDVPQLDEYVKRVIISARFRCEPTDFEACNKNAELQILRIIMLPVVQKVYELQNAVINLDKHNAMKISSELLDICMKGQGGV